MDNTERITFDNGEWWDIAPYMTWGASRAIRKVTRKHFTVDMFDENGVPIPGAMNIETSTLVNDAGEMARLLNCTVTWSREVLISEENINAWPEAYVMQVLQKMRQLYEQDRLSNEEVKAEKKD